MTRIVKNRNNNIIQSAVKRISKRLYDSIDCRKPGCKIKFKPTDKRQVYCTPQHRVDHNNDLRKIKNLKFENHNKILAKNQAILEKLFFKLNEMPKKHFHIDILRIENYSFGYMTDKSINEYTGNEIEWNFFYGLEGYCQNEMTFIVHNRKKIPV